MYNDSDKICTKLNTISIILLVLGCICGAVTIEEGLSHSDTILGAFLGIMVIIGSYITRVLFQYLCILLNSITQQSNNSNNIIKKLNEINNLIEKQK